MIRLFGSGKISEKYMKLNIKKLKQLIKEELQNTSLSEEFGSTTILQPDCVGPGCGMSLNTIEDSMDGFKFLSRRSEGYRQKAERFKANLSRARKAGRGPSEPQASVMIYQYIPPSEGYQGYTRKLGRLMSMESVTVDGKNKYKVTTDNDKEELLDFLMIGQKHTSTPSIYEGKLSKKEKAYLLVDPSHLNEKGKKKKDHVDHK